MATLIHINRVRTDTRRIIFKIVSTVNPTGEDIASWTGFQLIVDPSKAPTDNLANVATLTGFIIDAASGRVGFTPIGDIPTGNYFYNAKAIDNNGEAITFARGNYNIIENI